MLCSVFILLVFAGWSYGLQAPLYYQYKYYGSVSNGIQEISSQASGWAMKAEVNVYVLKNDGEAVFQIQNVKMVEFATDLKCDSRGDLPDELFLDIENPDLRSAFEAPFKTHLFHSEDYAIEYSEDEFPWLINVRKGIVSIFRNEILYGNIESQVENTISSSLHKGHVINVFSVLEETIFGKCSVHYTLHPIPEYMTGTRNKYLEEHYEQDVQRKVSESSAYTSKTSKKTSTYTAKSAKKDPRKSTKTPSKYQRSEVPEIKDDLWHVVRSVDFDQCEEHVGLQANTFDETPMHGGQHDWRRSRSSVSEYIFRGSPGHFRLETVLVEGSRTMAPYGVKTELLQSRINQTLHLVGVESFQVAPSLEGNIKHSNTWMFEFWSPASFPKESKAYPWVVYTGEGENFKISQIYGLNPPTEEERNLNWRDCIEHSLLVVPNLIEIIEEEDDFPLFPNVGETVSPLEKAKSLMKDMSKEDFLELLTYTEGETWTEWKKQSLRKYKKPPSYYEHMEKLYRKILIDVLASSGLNHAYEAILDLAKEEKISRFDLLTFFMTLSSNVNDPQIISSLMDYVTAFNIEERKFTVPTPSIIINFANFLNKMCLSPQAKSQYYYGPLFGDEKCPVHLIKDKFIPFLEKIIFNEKVTYDTDAAVIALGHLGGPYSYKLLSTIIREETKKFPIRTRVYAIESLDGRMYHEYNLRQVALNLLTEIVTKVGEDVSIREAALNIIFTWGPDNHFFYQLARMSWREPSRQFASLLTTMLDAMANVEVQGFKQYAQVASHALKLAKPVAPSFKYSYIASLVSNLVNKHSDSTYAIEWLTSDESSLIKNLYLGVFSNLGGFEGNQIEVDIETELFLKQFQYTYGWQLQSEGSMEGTFLKVAQEFYENIETYLKATLKLGPHQSTFRSDLSLSLLQHMKLFLTTKMNWVEFMFPEDPKNFSINFVKFISPINVRSVDPTELGIPLSMEIIAPIFLSFDGKLLQEESDLRNLVEFQAFLRLIEECHGSIEVLLPWSKKVARVESSSVREINLPINATFHVMSPENEKDHKLWEFYSPSVKVPLLRSASIPLSSVVSMYPLVENVQDKTLVLGPGDYPPVPKTVHVPKHFTGLDLSFTWKSNLEFPYIKYKQGQMLNDPGSFHEAPFMPLSFITSTLQYWELYIEFDPTSSSTQTISVFMPIGTFDADKHESITQERGEFSQYGQEGFGQYDQEQEGIQQGFEDGFQEAKEANADISRLTYEDSKELRLEKLQNIYGGSGGFKGFKVSFSGSEYRSFEALFVSSQQKSDDRKLKKSGVIFIRSPIPNVDHTPSLVCLNYESSSPSHKKLFNLKDFTSDNSLHKNTKFDVTLECTGEPILVIEGVYKISESWISKLQDDVPKYCDYDQINDMFTLHSHAVYNDVQFDFGWKRVCDHKYPLTSKAIQLLENAADRFLNYKCPNSEGTHKTHIEISRCPVTGNWDTNIQQEDLEKSFKNIPHNHIFNHLFTLGKKTSLELHPEIHSLYNWESDSCVFGVDSVRTFDGYSYEYKPSQCWSVAVRSCKRYEQNKILLLVRSPDTESTIPEVKYIDALRGIVVEYARNNIRVNGKIIDPVDGKEILKDDKGRILLTIIKNDDYFKVKLPKDLYFSVKNRVTVHAPSDLAGALCGLCGNFNGEPEDDLRGPQGCSYSDTNTFVASWTGKSDKCDLYTLLEMREDAENYQKQCTAIEDEHKLGLTMSHECYYSSREVRELEDRICVTKNYHLHCTANCQAVEQMNKNETFLCWPKEYAPSSLSEEANTEKSFVYYDLSEEHNSVSYDVQHPTLCLPIP